MYNDALGPWLIKTCTKKTENISVYCLVVVAKNFLPAWQNTELKGILKLLRLILLFYKYVFKYLRFASRMLWIIGNIRSR